MLEAFLSLIIILVVVGGLTLIANLADGERQKPTDSHSPNRYAALFLLLMGGIVGLNVMVFLNTLGILYLASTGDGQPISTANQIIAVVLTLLAVAFSMAFMLLPVRRFAARWLPKPYIRPYTPIRLYPLIQPILFPDASPPRPQETLLQTGGFRPESLVHMWAAILTTLFVVSQVLTYFLADGLEGVAAEIDVTYPLLMANFIPQVAIPLLGVGLLLRRNPKASLQRLGLSRLTWEGLVASVVITGALLMMVMIVSGFWMLLVSEETFEQQTQASQALAESINTLGLVFAVAFTASVGEEIAFRGALQPIFGFWITAFVFVLSHTQYILTPATLIILMVSLVLGLIRHYFNTTAAIVTHFLYNFLPLLLVYSTL